MPDGSDGHLVRDQRLPLFAFQTHAALDAIRSVFSGGRLATALAVYLAITERANKSVPDAGGFRAHRAEVAADAGVSLDTLDRYVKLLVVAEVLIVERQVGREKANVWILRDPLKGRTGAAIYDVKGRTGAAISPRASMEVNQKPIGDTLVIGERVVLRDAWLANAPPLQRHRDAYFDESRALAKALKAALKVYPVEDIVRAVTNYATVLGSTDYRWSYSWTLDQFLARGLDRFTDEAEPLRNFRAKKGGFTADDFSDIDDI